jgi:hypothetical protein
MLSRWLPRIGVILLLCLTVSITASAQYGGGGGTGGSGSGGSSSTSSGYGSGNGKAIGIGVGAAAAATVGIVLYLHHRHKTAKAARSQASIIGCTRSEVNGMSLKNEKDNEVYLIITSGTPLQVGQRVKLTGVTDQGPGARTFLVRGPVRSFGTCKTTTAGLVQPQRPRNNVNALVSHALQERSRIGEKDSIGGTKANDVRPAPIIDLNAPMR